MRVLVTGFEPFSATDNEPPPASNASSEAVRRIEVAEVARRAGVPVEIIALTDVPVRWSDGPATILERWRDSDAELLVAVGETGAPTAPRHLRLEPAARNHGAGVDQATPRRRRLDGTPLFAGEPERLPSTVTAGERAALVERLRAEGIDAVEGDDDSAGAYLCNASYYTLLREAGARPVLFVHVRALRDEESLALLARALEIIVAALVELRKDQRV